MPTSQSITIERVGQSGSEHGLVQPKNQQVLIVWN